MLKLLMTPEEAAESLSISRSKLYELLAAGEVESVRIGGSRRIPVDGLVEFVARRREAAAEPDSSDRLRVVGEGASVATIGPEGKR